MLKYEEGRCIGRGSYGSAHLVTERATNQRYVIKKIPMELLSESEKQQSFREVELLAKLKHPNVVEYKESFVENNVIHIVMAYCDGGDLAGRIKERAAIAANGGHGYFDTRQILDWFVQMAMAIKYLHEQRILHRDLKTSNIFLTTQNVIKLGDFGIAKTLDSTLDQAKTVVGTPYYMSPEVCESKPYSYASDVWSLGCVLYEIVALKHAFDAPNILTLILKIVQNDVRILRRIADRAPRTNSLFLLSLIITVCCCASTLRPRDLRHT
jgi:NIMA (never in mitosis gene a)-related kinase 1/4/5